MFMYVVKKSFKDLIKFFRYYFICFPILIAPFYSLTKEANLDILQVIIFVIGIILLFFIIFEIWFYIKNIGYKNECDYYRELPRDYSPSMVSYLLNLKSEFKKDIIADLIFLEQRKIIHIDDNKNIIILKNNVEWKESENHLKFIIDVIIPNYQNIEKISKLSKRKLSSSENSVFSSSSSSSNLDKEDYRVIQDYLNSNMDALEIRKNIDEYIKKKRETIDSNDLFIVQNKTEDKNIEIMRKYQKLIVKDLKACDLICDAKMQIFYKISAIILILCLIITMVDSSFISHKINLLTVSMIITFFLGIFLLIIITETIKYVRTKKGKQDVSLWISYYKFLKDFSVMHSRNFEEKNLWGYYFAYGLSLGINKKIISKFNLEHENDIIK